MRTLYSLAAVVGLASAAIAPSAKAADWSVGVQVGLPRPVVAVPPAYYVPPRYYVPRPVYAPVYDPPGYYGPPVRYYRPPVAVYEHEYWGHYGWRHHHDHDRDGY